MAVPLPRHARRKLREIAEGPVPREAFGHRRLVALLLRLGLVRTAPCRSPDPADDGRVISCLHVTAAGLEALDADPEAAAGRP